MNLQGAVARSVSHATISSALADALDAYRLAARLVRRTGARFHRDPTRANGAALATDRAMLALAQERVLELAAAERPVR